MKTVAMTGGTGFVGANLARRLVRDGHKLHLLVRPGYSPWRLTGLPDSEIHVTHLEDPEETNSVIHSIRPDWVFHLATHGAYSWQTDVREILQTNIIGTVNLVQACLRTGFESFVNTGSSSEYGLKDHAPSEDERPEPNSFYAVAKVSATMFCRFVAQSERVHIPTLRLYSVYGPYEDPMRLIPALIINGIHNQLPTLASPEIARDYVYVEDVCNAYILAAAQPTGERGALYNVGTGRQTSLRQIVAKVCELLELDIKPVWSSMPDRCWDTDFWVADNSKISEQLSWHPANDLERGLASTIEWFRENPQMTQKYIEELTAAGNFTSSAHAPRNPST
jgi:nucleoside-diphosphate-sugar epimerase